MPAGRWRPAGDAYAVLAGCWDWCARMGLAAEYRVLGPDLIRLALASGDADRARAAAADRSLTWGASTGQQDPPDGRCLTLPRGGTVNT